MSPRPDSSAGTAPRQPSRRSRLRVLVWGDGRWAADTAMRLAADGHAVVGVVIRRRPSDDSLAQAAHALGAPLLQPADPHAPDVVATLAALRADLALSVSYDRLLRTPVLALPAMGTLNVHAGMLPRYRGRNPINWAIANGEREIGVTVHYMDAGFDTGDVVAQQSLAVEECDDYGTVLGRVVALIPTLAARAVAAIAAGTAERRPQAHELATYYRARGAADEWIDWEAPTSRIHDLVRAIARPGPGARTLLGGRSLRVWRATPGPALGRASCRPGLVVACGAKGAAITTGDGTLLVTDATLDDATRDDASSATPDWRIGRILGRDAHDRHGDRPRHPHGVSSADAPSYASTLTTTLVEAARA